MDSDAATIVVLLHEYFVIVQNAELAQRRQLLLLRRLARLLLPMHHQIVLLRVTAEMGRLLQGSVAVTPTVAEATNMLLLSVALENLLVLPPMGRVIRGWDALVRHGCLGDKVILLLRVRDEVLVVHVCWERLMAISLRLMIGLGLLVRQLVGREVVSLFFRA